ncbi:hypothetical protein DSL72_006358 [Monilinia vaccinii-corymbosi]|uniref:Pre-mRNA-splicing factor 38B n=1 Tax=Monilinia vaccinii-corymbosi TaxID=61207 RepID=A0A8A3PNI1_9HELO|nr:hypothetical protein DSL72_006358 [Monilinia vaccinii-corymbosi]
MANDTYLTDDYVADLLAKDAKASSIKYSSMGLEAYAKESKPPANKPKPNTRFLRNIIRDTDNHNSALLAKEAAEARARLEGLSNGERQRRVAPVDIRRRQLGDIKAILGGPVKRKREDSGRGGEGKTWKPRDAEDTDRRSRRKDMDISAELIGYRRRESRRTETKQDDEELNGDRRRSKDRRNKYQDEDSREDSNKPQRREHRRRRSISEDRDRTKEERRRRHRERSRSPKEHRSKESGHRERDRSPHSRRKPSLSPTSEDERKSSYRPYKTSSSRPQKQSEPEPEQDSDSDPLDSIIGPRPANEKQALRIRGRGATSLGSTSVMDSRFHADYDPKTDVQLEDAPEDDWDQALEALYDRQKWQAQGANRLRDAGFSEEEVKKWERGGLGEKREEDVKWRAKGQSREWDRGKVVKMDGTVGFETGWGDETSKDFGRLK